MKNPLPTDKQLADEAKQWDERKLSPVDWKDTPQAVPRGKESLAISIRMPRQMIAILKEFAARSGIGYQVLIKQWLDERIRQESHDRKQSKAKSGSRRSASV